MTPSLILLVIGGIFLSSWLIAFIVMLYINFRNK